MTTVPAFDPRLNFSQTLDQFSDLTSLETRFKSISNQQRKWDRAVVICSIAIGIIGGMVYRLAYQSTYKYAALGVGSALFLVSLVIGRIIPSPFTKFMNSFKEAALEIRTARVYKSKAICECLKRQKPLPNTTYQDFIVTLINQYSTNSTPKDAFTPHLNSQEKKWREAYLKMYNSVDEIAALNAQDIAKLPKDFRPVVENMRTEAIRFIWGSNDTTGTVAYVDFKLEWTNESQTSVKVKSAEPWPLSSLSF